MAHTMTRLHGARLSEWWLHGGWIDAVITPKPGLLVAFPTNHKFAHAVSRVLSGKRCSLPVWFTV